MKTGEPLAVDDVFDTGNTIKAVIEELEGANEDLKSANEELMTWGTTLEEQNRRDHYLSPQVGLVYGPRPWLKLRKACPCTPTNWIVTLWPAPAIRTSP